MKSNIGTIDKIVRFFIAVVIAILYFINIIHGTTGIILLIVAAVLLISILISFCVLYPILGISTCGKKPGS